MVMVLLHCIILVVMTISWLVVRNVYLEQKEQKPTIDLDEPNILKLPRAPNIGQRQASNYKDYEIDLVEVSQLQVQTSGEPVVVIVAEPAVDTFQNSSI